MATFRAVQAAFHRRAEDAARGTLIWDSSRAGTYRFDMFGHIGYERRPRNPHKIVRLMKKIQRRRHMGAAEVARRFKHDRCIFGHD